MIEYTNINNDTMNPIYQKPIDEKEYKEKIINAVTLDTKPTSEHNIVRSLTVDNIYNDNGDFVFSINDKPIGINIKIPRDLLKKVIYDIYLK